MSDSLSNSNSSDDSRTSRTESVHSVSLSKSESTTNAPKEPDTFQYTDDQFIFTSQNSGDNRHSLQYKINYPKESELSNVLFTELSKVDQNLEMENICALCLPDEICRCTIKLGINRLMRIQKPDATKIKHYLDFSPENVRHKKSHLKSFKDKPCKSSIPSKSNKDSCVSFWFRFFGHRATSRFCRVDLFLDSINVNAENATSHKYVVQNVRSKFRAISEGVGNSVLISSQNSFNDFLENSSFKPVSLDNSENSSWAFNDSITSWRYAAPCFLEFHGLFSV